jgi:8-oxo-dGTP pyrophosphatase MutT (NUDIX family)
MTGVRRFRNSAKAIIIDEGRLLAVGIHDDNAGDFYVLPGGGQEPGETLHEALQRECREEIGSPVIVHELCFVRDYIGHHHQFSGKDADLHIVELLFRCELVDPALVGRGNVPDTGQTGVAWLELDRLAERRFYPATLRPLLRQPFPRNGPVYLGDVS